MYKSKKSLILSEIYFHLLLNVGWIQLITLRERHRIYMFLLHHVSALEYFVLMFTSRLSNEHQWLRIDTRVALSAFFLVSSVSQLI